MTSQNAAPKPIQCHQLAITGTVQGVGFRPAVRQLAIQCGLTGWVRNSTEGAIIEVEGDAQQLATFIAELPTALPPSVNITDIQVNEKLPSQAQGFEIKNSAKDGRRCVTVPPDLAPCPSCLREFHDPLDRRYHYPFISCTACGPRWSVLHELPYDRAQTSFAEFSPCDRCTQEYSHTQLRRSHHQTISCPQCGPTLFLSDSQSRQQALNDDALKGVARALSQGKVVALKSVGGFQLLVDAHNPEAIERLRQRKQRPAKPLAVMFAHLKQLQHYAHTDAFEREALLSAARPIVLLKSKGQLSKLIAPGNPSPLGDANGTVGAMLPPSALHEALFTTWQTPLVATSGNPGGEPLCFDNDEAIKQLGDIADVFLLHDLTISQPLDDSVIRIINQRPVTIRAGRGLAPLLISLSPPIHHQHLLACGGHQKNSIAVNVPEGIVASAHIGDLDNVSSLRRFAATVNRIKYFTNDNINSVISDPHPEYGSSHWAADSGYPRRTVQHHVAHFFSAMAEHDHRGPALGVCWDGSGLGDDGNLWGGEFFYWDGNHSVRRMAHLRPFALPGAAMAIREPRRQALGLLAAAELPAPAHLRNAFCDHEWHNLQQMLNNKLNSPLCTSAGRLIDAVAALLECAHYNRFEADAAMRLEALADNSACDNLTLPLSVKNANSLRIIDWQPSIKQLLVHQSAGVSRAELAAAFFRCLAQMITTIATEFDKLPVFLTGGVFQNKRLTETTLDYLQQRDQPVFTQQRVSPNDGGLAVGQLYYSLLVARNKTAGSKPCV